MKNYLIAFAVFFAIAARANVALPGLMPSASEFQWEGWDIKIVALYFTDGITTPFGEKRSQEDSVFVYLSLMVKNNSDHGNPFIPQNNLKILAGDNTFDAEDVEQGGENYIENIEPTLTRRRGCYIELPKVVIRQPFTLQFGSLLGSQYVLHVSAVNPQAIEYYNRGYAEYIKGNYDAALGDDSCSFGEQDELRGKERRVVCGALITLRARDAGSARHKRAARVGARRARVLPERVNGQRQRWVAQESS
jgi:hypothetical protein